MGEVIALALKLGIGALPAISLEWGPFVALFAFFAFMPLGHMTIGVLLVIIGSFIPVIPEGNKTHDLGLGSHLATLKASGSARTVLMGIGALVIVGSFVEAVR
jgi:hypothetical protein